MYELLIFYITSDFYINLVISAEADPLCLYSRCGDTYDISSDDVNQGFNTIYIYTNV